MNENKTTAQRGQIQDLLSDLSGKLTHLPGDLRAPIQADLQRIQALVDDLDSSSGCPHAGEPPVITGAFFDNLQEAALVYQIIRDQAGKIVDWTYLRANQAALTFLGHDSDSFIGQRASQLFEPEYLGRAAAEMQQLFISGEAITREESYQNRQFLVRLFQIDENTVGRLATDITERKQAEQQLRAASERFALSEAMYRDIANSITDPLAAYDDDLRLIYRNEAAKNATLLPDELALGRTFTELYPSLEGSEAHQAYLRAVQTRQAQRCTVHWVRPIDQRQFSYDLSIYPAMSGVVASSKDISERYRAEEALRKALEHATWMASFPDENPNPVARMSTDGIVLYRNRIAGELPGWKLEAGEPIPAALQPLLHQQTPLKEKVEQDITLADRIYLITLVPFLDDQYINMYGSDITERTLTDRLNRALNEIDQIIHSSLDFDEITNRSISAAAHALSADSAALSLRKDGHWLVSGVYGLSTDILGVEMDDTQEVHAVLAIQTKKPVPVIDAFNDERFNREHLRQWGIRSVFVMPVIVKDEAIGVMFFNYQTAMLEFNQAYVDFVTRLAASLSLALENAQLYRGLEDEISVRTQVEESLRASEARERTRANELETLMDAVPSMIWIARDPECRVMIGNRLGYEFLRMGAGQNISVSAPDAAVANQHYQNMKDGVPIPAAEMPMQIAAATGKSSRDFMFDMVFDDGSKYQLIGNVNPLFDDDGKPCGAVGAFVDITLLRRLEEEKVEARAEIEVQRRLMEYREKERQGLARDLHDGPIQTLAGTAFNIQFIKEAFNDPALRLELEQISFSIKNTIRDLRETVNDLRPPSLIRFGLTKAIQIHTEDMRERHPEITFETDLEDDKNQLSEQACLTLFRIYQEGLTNALRHSGASKILVVYRVTGSEFRLELHDNGRGFTVMQDLTDITSQGHFGLVGIKERAQSVGGEFTITSEPGKGTLLAITGPLLGKNLK